MQGFISWMGMTVGHRMMTVTPWETPRIIDRCITRARTQKPFKGS